MRSLYLVSMVGLTVLLACSPSRDRLEDPGDDSETFTFGPAKVFQLAGTPGEAVPDSASGATIVFPDGASGVLRISPITRAPAPAFLSGAGFRLEAPAGARVQIRLTADSAEVVPITYVYGHAQGCLDGGTPRDARWVSLPDKVWSDGTLTFDVPSLPGSKRAVPAILWIEFKYWTGFNQLIATARNYINAAVDALPEPLRTETRNKVRDDMAYEILPSTEGEGSYYTGFGWVFPSTVAPRIFLRLSAARDVIAHETGHYMTHLLGGNAAYRIIESKAPDENHGVAVLYDGRQTITEEYAYFMQYFHIDEVNGGDARVGGWLAGVCRKTPAQVDYPSLEGFGCALMASVTRPTASDSYDFMRERTPTPAGGLTKSQVLVLYTRGASDINTLAGYVEEAMAGAGRADAYRVIAERLGWSYHGRGIIRMPGGAPCQGATVQAEITADGIRYLTPQATTGSDGQYVLPRLFPGASILRVVKGTQGAELPISIQWTDVTTEEIQIPDIQLQLAPSTVVGAVSYSDPVWNTPPLLSSTGLLSLTGVQPILQRNVDGNFSATVLKDTPCSVNYHIEHTWSPNSVFTTTNPDGSRVEVTWETPRYDPDHSILATANGQVPLTVSVSSDTLTVQFTLTSVTQSVVVNATMELSTTTRSYDSSGNLLNTTTEVVNHRSISNIFVEAAMP
jgi:hypothetical protein